MIKKIPILDNLKVIFNFKLPNKKNAKEIFYFIWNTFMNVRKETAHL